MKFHAWNNPRIHYYLVEGETLEEGLAGNYEHEHVLQSDNFAHNFTALPEMIRSGMDIIEKNTCLRFIPSTIVRARSVSGEGRTRGEKAHTAQHQSPSAVLRNQRHSWWLRLGHGM